MTDLIFLLLIFFVCTSTMVNPNALKLLLPQSSNQTAARATTSVTITKDLRYLIENTPVAFNDLERQLQLRLADTPEPTISINVDVLVPAGDLVKVLNIVQRNKWTQVLNFRH